MGFFSDIFGGSDDRTPEERKVDVLQHKAYKDAANTAARKLSRSDPLIHDMLNEAHAEAQQHVSKWRW
jgi:hypothetical protein